MSVKLSFSHVLLFLFVFTLSWTALLRWGGVFTITNSLLLAIVLFVILYLLSNGLRLKITHAEFARLFPVADLILVLLLLLFIFSILSTQHGQALNRMSFFLLVVSMYVSLKLLIVIGRFSIDDLLNYILISVTFISVFMIIEFVSRNALGIDIRANLPVTREATARFSGIAFRAYGLATEPTSVAFFFNAFLALAIYRAARLSVSTAVRVPIIILPFLAFSLTLSPTILFFFGAFVFWFLTLGGWRRLDFFKYIGAGLVVVMAMGYFLSLFLDLDVVFESYQRQLALEDGVGAEGSRVTRWEDAMNLFFASDILFGLGKGFFSTEWGTTPVNFYVMTLVENGILGFLMFLSFFGAHIFIALKIKHGTRLPILVGISASLVHLNAVSLFWWGYIWFLLAFSCFVYSREARV